jgi:hypothetical protein
MDNSKFAQRKHTGALESLVQSGELPFLAGSGLSIQPRDFLPRRSESQSDVGFRPEAMGWTPPHLIGI